MTQAIYAQYGLTKEVFPAPFADSVFKRNATNDGWESITIASLLSSATGSVTFSGVSFQGFAPPISPSSPATKEYVDGLVQGLSFKAAVVAATTAALPASTYANGTLGAGATLTANANGVFPAVDGATVNLNDSVLVKNEASPATNGIYKLTQLGDGSTPWILTRRDDANIAAELAGAFVYVEAGSTNSGGSYALPLRTSAITVGTTGLNWTLFSSASVLSVTAPYLTRVGNTVSAVVSTTAGEVQPLGSAAAGSTGKLADIGHVHAHGNQAGGSLHALATSLAAGFMSAAQFTQLANLPAILTDGQDTTNNTPTNVGAAQYTPAAGRVTLIAVATAKEKLTNAWGASFVFLAQYASDGVNATVQGGNDPVYIFNYDGGQGVVAKFTVTGNVINVTVISNNDQVHWTATLFAFPA